jgi:hypothetical protein
MATERSNRRAPPRGRQTIRRSGSLTGTHGPVSRAIRLWEFDAKPGTLLARLKVPQHRSLAPRHRDRERFAPEVLNSTTYVPSDFGPKIMIRFFASLSFAANPGFASGRVPHFAT